MLVSFFKGFLLFGALLWYSIAMMTVINDYFRVEFNTYLKKEPVKSKVVAPSIAIPVKS